MKNIIVFFMAINTVISILSMEKAPAQPIIKSDYYSLENLKKLSTQKIEQHIPCYIFIDQTNEDNPDSQESAGVLLAMLTEAIDAGYYCMIVSHSLVQSFLVRKNPDHPYKLTADLFQSKWMLYEIPNTQFFLFIPKTYEAFYKKGFNTARMQNLTPLLPQRGSDYQELTRHISRTVYYPMFSSNQLNSIFSLNKNIIWDFVIDGHGAPYDQIAGLKPESINKLLHFFDTKLSTGVIYLISCYLGGTNLSLLDFKNQHVSVIHPYILIAGSIAEMTSHFHRDFSEFIKKYFNAAAHLEDRGESLNELLQAVNYFSKETGPIHGTGQLAQVWLPGGLGFQTFNIDKALFWLGNVTLKTHEEEHKPILIQNKQAVLLYPDTIGVPLKVSPYNYGSQALRELTSSLIPRLSEIYEQDEQGFLENFDQNPDSFPSLLKIANPRNYSGLEWISQIDQFLLGIKTFLFPEFISMIRGKATHYFTSIEIENNAMPQLGVLQFLRDAFLDVGTRLSKKTFAIDTLIGNNDINILLEAARAMQNKFDPYPIEKIAAENTINGIIILKDILITSSVSMATDKLKFSLRFTLGNKTWTLTDYSEKPWYFTEGIAKAIPIKKQPSQIEQKSISTVLKHKKETMAIRKSLEIERKKAAESAIKKYKQNISQ